MMQANPVYSNSSGNSSFPKRSQPAAVYVLLYFFSAFLVILTVCGNLLVIISISHFRQLHTPTNILILSLAVADLLLGIFGIPFAMIKIIENCWYFGEILCLVYKLVAFFLTSVSISNLVFIAVDRYIALCDPLRYTSIITVYFVSIFIALGWAFSLVYNVIIISMNRIDSSEGQDGCQHDCFVILSETFIMVDLIITFILPFSVMIILYFKIFTVAKKHAQLISSAVQNCKGGKNKISKTSERKAAKKLGIVIGIFLLCWVPYYLCGIIDSYLHVTAPPLAKNIFISLAYINSSINPIIYALVYPWFQKSVRLIITLKILSPESSLTSLFNDSQ
ncbi:trace amine-associated receptor 13c-like [Erpetoichthys calabaricus]|uniref:trace amine-associated receptor 13c-like n=1 Tax=Erpetoichthys calabaricus TaxID=27687 RepID=UPI002234307A|nr:trace amine-associated receptor 13c-like [Erpetoichthys calabaricus]